MTAYLRPSTLEEALGARAAHPDYQVLAGGTDLLVAGHRAPAPAGILDVFGLAPLRAIAPAPEGGYRLGAATTYLDILGSEQIREALPMLFAAVREIGALQIQARGTLGGNLVTSSPVGDTLPVWLALDAEIELASARGVRRVPYREFCTGYRQTALATDELVTAVVVPPVAPGTCQFWRKVGTRRAQSISKLMVAAAARLDEGRIVEPRIGLGAVADRPIRGAAVEEVLAFAEPSLELAERAREALVASIQPIDDVRSRAAYRRRVAGNLVYRFVCSLQQAP
jgi:CO/xanthine dehydrogenase FAD-binding subunit